jgi:hypothetical protein
MWFNDIDPFRRSSPMARGSYRFPGSPWFRGGCGRLSRGPLFFRYWLGGFRISFFFRRPVRFDLRRRR